MYPERRENKHTHTPSYTPQIDREAAGSRKVKEGRRLPCSTTTITVVGRTS